MFGFRDQIGIRRDYCMNRRIQGLIVGGLIGALVAGGVAYGVTVVPSASTDVYYACVHPSGYADASTIRLNRIPRNCVAGETIRSWSAQGPQGVQGIPGVPGMPGSD